MILVSVTHGQSSPSGDPTPSAKTPETSSDAVLRVAAFAQDAVAVTLDGVGERQKSCLAAVDHFSLWLRACHTTLHMQYRSPDAIHQTVPLPGASNQVSTRRTYASKHAQRLAPRGPGMAQSW